MKRIILLALTFAIIVTGCGATDSNNPGPNQAAPTDQIPVDTPVAQNPSAPPSVSDAILLINSPQADPSLSTDVHGLLSQYATNNGWALESAEALSAESLHSAVKIVVALAPTNDINQWAASAPQVQFITLSISAVSAAENITSIYPNDQFYITQAFIAGHIASMQTDQWRVGMIGTNSPSEELIKISFENGYRYFCGLCVPKFEPFDYPIFATQDNLAGLVNNLVETTYIAPSAESGELYQLLSQTSIKLIGTASPSDAVAGQWMISLQPNYLLSLQNILPLVLTQGSQGQIIPDLQFANINFDNLSEARLIYIQQLLAEIQQGIIDPYGK